MGLRQHLQERHPRQGSTAATDEGAYGGIPFPIPKDGAEAMWNHVLRGRGAVVQCRYHVPVVTADGKRGASQVGGRASTTVPLLRPERALDRELRRHLLHGPVPGQRGPPFRARRSVLGASTRWTEQDAQVWQYLVGQRRVRRSPSFAYDTPNYGPRGSACSTRPICSMARWTATTGSCWARRRSSSPTTPTHLARGR